MLDVTRLRVLLAVARHGSVTAAATALHYAQPSVSHHLARLEAETGAQLVQRVGRGIRLTAAGRLLAERAEEIIGRLDAAEAELAEHSGLRAGRVRLAAFPSALGSFVPLAAARFAASHPAVALTLVEAEPPEALELLRSGDVDLAVVFDYGPPPAGSPDGVRLVPLFAEPLHLVTLPDAARDLASFARARWIAGCERCRQSLVERCTAAGFTPQIAFTTDDYVAVQSLVAAGLGVTILPDLALRAHHSAAVRAVPLPGGARHVSAALYGAPPDPPAPARLLAALLETAPAG
ncbi:LysR family transcriptional regulator [Dactylosporangium fulvum]|uniref:LysR family transcriptional regulator n=1 Tax=Dactylosporangium fulvum TaxID=53359 RepID=A0ABY5W8S7_9ACTN|nr:LysR family transcriptional regulator [Dactylosporangium fulvum]UWP85962.1 LysR family transcriptional regulator [Dactylosporangium fulvum]